MNKIFKVKRNSRGQSVVCSEIAKSHTAGKVTAIAAGITLALVSGGASAAAYAPEGYSIGDNSVAVGVQSFATGVNSVAIGDNAVATGDNLTAEEISQKMAENKQRLQAIEDQKVVVRTSEADFAAKHEVRVRVQNADQKIAKHREDIANNLQPKVDIATNNYNDYLPVYEAKKSEYEARVSSLTTMSGFDLTKATTVEGVTQLATDLKTQAEKGFENIINEPVSYYEDYIRNYIQAKGELANNEKNFVDIYNMSAGSKDLVNNPLLTNANYTLDGYYIGNDVHRIIISVPEYNNTHLTRISAISYNTDAGGIKNFSIHDNNNLAKTPRLSKNEYDQIKGKIDKNLNNTIAWIDNAGLWGAQTPEEIEAAKNITRDDHEMFNNYALAKFYQGEYERLGGSTTAEGLEALKNSISALSAANEYSNGKLDNYFRGKISEWQKENISDIKSLNLKFVNDFKANLTKMLSAERKNHDQLLNLKRKAEDEVVKINQKIEQLEPSRADRATAEAAEPAYQELLAQKTQLDQLIADLTLNDLKNIGANAIAVGGSARATGNSSTAIGFNANANSKNSIALGTESLAVADNAIAIGTENTVSGEKSIAIGYGHKVTGNDSFVAGNNNAVDSNNVMVLGNNITVGTGFDNSVVFGNNSAPTQANPTANISLLNTTHNFAGKNPISTVSVGAEGNERQIANVAAGRVTATSTDAVNGSQLFATTQAITTLNSKVDAKADKTYVDSELAKKADKSDSEALKQNITNSIQPVLDTKVDKTYVDAELAKKADKSDLDALKTAIDGIQPVDISGKADKADVDAKNATQDAAIAANTDAIKALDDKKADKADLDVLSDVVDTKANQSDLDALADVIDTKADQSALDATNDKLNALDNAAVKYDDPAVKDKVTLGGANGTAITNVMDGALTADSKDAVNGSQLYTLSEKMKNLTGADVVAGNGTTVTKATKDNVNTYTVSVSDETLASITKAQTDATQALSDAKAADTKATAAQNTANDALVKADNAQATADKAQADVKALDEVVVKYDNPSKDSVTLAGAGGTTITNVKAGTISANSTDAVNGGQLFDVYNYVNQGNDAMRQHINTVEDKLQAGIAGSNASAALPQVRGNGKSMMAFGLGGFQDKGAVAVGYSRSSDNGRTVFKAHLNADTEKQLGGGIGLGFEW